MGAGLGSSFLFSQGLFLSDTLEESTELSTVDAKLNETPVFSSGNLQCSRREAFREKGTIQARKGTRNGRGEVPWRSQGQRSLPGRGS